MGKLGYAIGKGLQSAGIELGKYDAQKEEKERYDADAKRKQEAHEANLKAMDIRNTQLTLANNLKQVELTNKRIATVFTQTNGDPAAVSKAISQYGKGFKERYLEAESREATKEAGHEVIVTENGVWETDENNAEKVDSNGKPIFKRLSGKAGIITRTRPEFNDHIGRVLNPNNAFAEISKNQTQRELWEKNEIINKSKEEAAARAALTPGGIAKRKLIEAQTELTEKRSANIGKPDTPKPPQSYVTNIKGKKVARTHAESSADTASMKIIAKDHPEWGVTSPEQAYRINELKNDAKLRAALAQDIEKAVADPEYEKKLVVDGALKLRVPEAMLRKMITTARENAEIIETQKGGMKKWLKDFFGGGGEKPPEIYNDKQAGGLS